MRLTEPLFSTAAVGIALVIGAAAIPVLAYEQHPDLQAALQRLRQARYELSHASHDFSGYRERALQETDRAISDTQRALQSD